MGTRFYKILLIALILSTGYRVRAQIDTLFWFAAPEVNNMPYISDRPIYLRITTYGQPATVAVSQPAGGGMPTQTIAVAANSTQSIDLTAWIDFIENKPPNIVLNYGLKITSTAPVSVYYDVVSGGGINAIHNPEVFSLKGGSALGTDFLIPSQNYINNASGYTPTPYNSFDIIATENNTSITITPSANITGHAAGSTINVVLNEGQTWSGTAVSQSAAQHLQGSRITADKPVAVTVKDDQLHGTPFGGCSDLAGDQIVPVSLLGTEYIAMRGRLNAPHDQIFITALQNGTTITHNGTLVTTINAGATYQLAVSSPSSYVQTNNPVSVWQLSGIGCEVSACQLPQIECTGSKSVSYTRTNNTGLYFNILVRNGGQGGFLVNGVPGVITAGQFTVVPNTGGNWYSAQVDMPLAAYAQGSVINVSNNSSLFHLGALEGSANTGSSYGYFSNFGLVNAEAAASSDRVCVGDTIRLFANTIQGAVYQWTGPGGFNSTQQNPVIPHASSLSSGVYTLNVSALGCGNATDTVRVSVHEYPDAYLGNDVSLCADSLTLRPTNAPIPGSSYVWSTGASSDSLRVGQSDTYWLRVTSNGCTATDTIEVDLNGSLTVDLGPDVFICDVDTPYILTSPQPAGSRYVWSNGWGYPDLSVTRSGRYWLQVEHNGCVASDTVQVTMVPTPVVDLGSDTTICEQFPHRIGTEIAGATYSWSTGASDPYISVSATGDYILEVDVQACVVSDTVAIVAEPAPVIDLGGDRDICPDQIIRLDATHGSGVGYLWNTGERSSSYEALSAGVYSVAVTTLHGCVGGDTVVLTAASLPVVQLGIDTTVCEETPLLLRPFAINAESLLWSDGSSGDVLQVRHGGVYTVSGFNDCGSDSDTIEVRQIFCDIWVPNVFTPNGDGKNDVFRVLGNVGRADHFGLSVFDRWGQRVFYTTDKYQGWDGVFNGTPCMMGTFVYMLEYHIEGKPFIEKGNFHLLR